MGKTYRHATNKGRKAAEREANKRFQRIVETFRDRYETEENDEDTHEDYPPFRNVGDYQNANASD